MLQLRPDQMEALGSVSREQFLVDLGRELWDFAPPLARVIGVQGARELARLAESTAAAENLTFRSSVRLVMQLMCVLGCELTVDPQLPWVREILDFTRERSEPERTRLLHRRSLAYLDEVQGPRTVHAVRALREIERVSTAEIRAAAAAGEDGFAQLAARVFPRKHAFIGGRALRTLHARADAEARELELGPEGTLILAALALALGSGVTHDPCYPWITRTLRGPGFGQGPRRTVRLYRRVGIYAYRVLHHLAPAVEADAQI
jgi:hypothetical protein